MNKHPSERRNPQAGNCRCGSLDIKHNSNGKPAAQPRDKQPTKGNKASGRAK